MRFRVSGELLEDPLCEFFSEEGRVRVLSFDLRVSSLILGFGEV